MYQICPPGHSWGNGDKVIVAFTKWTGLYCNKNVLVVERAACSTDLLVWFCWILISAVIFFPVSSHSVECRIQSQCSDSTRPHKVSFVQLWLCCPVEFYGFSCECGSGAQWWSSPIENLHQLSDKWQIYVCLFYTHSSLNLSVPDREWSGQSLACRSASSEWGHRCSYVFIVCANDAW